MTIAAVRSLVVGSLIAGAMVVTGTPAGASNRVSSRCPAPSVTPISSGSFANGHGAVPYPPPGVGPGAAQLLALPPAAQYYSTLDMAGDGHVDTVSINSTNDGIDVVRGDGTLTISFASSPGLLQAVQLPGRSIDINGDGRDELVLTAIIPAHPHGFAETVVIPGTTPTGTIAIDHLNAVVADVVGDVTGDGHPDLSLSTNSYGDTFTEYWSGLDQLNGTPQTAIDYIGSLADLDQDGTPDRVYLGSADGTHPARIVLSGGGTIPVPSPRPTVVYVWRDAVDQIYLEAVTVTHYDPVSPTGTWSAYRLNVACSTPLVEAIFADLYGRAPTAAELSGVSSDLTAHRVSVEMVAYPGALSAYWVDQNLTRVYQQILNRAPDPGGLAAWDNRIRVHGWPLAKVVALLAASPEANAKAGGTTAAWVTAMYQAMIGRAPDPGGLAYWTAQARLDRNKAALHLYQSKESAGRRAAFLITQLLKRPADPGGTAYWGTRVVRDGDLPVASSLASTPEYYLNAQHRYP